MTLFAKIAQARKRFAEAGVKPTGVGGGGRFEYFDLEDILPVVTPINAELGILPLCSFTSDLATLTVYDTETGDKTELTSPMSTAKLSGCHEVQNLGAVETYIKRYLYQNLYDVVNNDQLDGGELPPEPKPAKKQAPEPKKQPAPKKQTALDTPAFALEPHEYAQHLAGLIKGTSVTTSEIKAYLEGLGKTKAAELTYEEFMKLDGALKEAIANEPG